jgi:hypothetical protein
LPGWGFCATPLTLGCVGRWGRLLLKIALACPSQNLTRLALALLSAGTELATHPHACPVLNGVLCRILPSLRLSAPSLEVVAGVERGIGAMLERGAFRVLAADAFGSQVSPHKNS